MSEARQKFLCDAVAAVNGDRLFITVFKVNDGIEFESGRGDMKYGSPRREWTPELIRHEIAQAFGARSVEIIQPPDPSAAAGRSGSAEGGRKPMSTAPRARHRMQVRPNPRREAHDEPV